MQLRIMVFALFIANLSGCALIKERQEAREQAYFTKAQEACKRYGFVEKTDTFAQCMQNDVNTMKARDAADERAFHNSMKSTNTSCSTTSSGMDCTTR